MKRCLALSLLLAGLVATHQTHGADKWVVVTSQAQPAYTQKKFEGDHPRLEHYVLMEGRYYAGGVVDGSLEKMTFRKIAESFAPELARKNYLPAKEIKEADLLIVIDWGATLPRAGNRELRAETGIRTDYGDVGGVHTANMFSPDENALQFDRMEQLTEQIDTAVQSATNAGLLGYNKELHRLGRGLMAGEEESSLRADLSRERYFVIIKAYDLKAASKEGARRPVWTLHANVGSPGNNFNTALTKIGNVAVDFFGRSTDKIQSLKARPRDGVVVVGDVTIVNEPPSNAEK